MFPIPHLLSKKEIYIRFRLQHYIVSILYCLRTVSYSVQAEIVSNAVEKSTSLRTMFVEQTEGAA
jgi:hypothetical protein